MQNVTVWKTVFTGTQNGLRIKSWARPSNGFVKGVRFIDALMQNVQNPIIIDQNYCPHNLNCPGQVRKFPKYFFVNKGKDTGKKVHKLNFLFFLFHIRCRE